MRESPLALTQADAESTAAYLASCASGISVESGRLSPWLEESMRWHLSKEASGKACQRLHYLLRATEELVADVAREERAAPAAWEATMQIVQACHLHVHKALTSAVEVHERNCAYAAAAATRQLGNTFAYPTAITLLAEGYAVRRRAWPLGTYVKMLPYNGTGPHMTHLIHGNDSSTQHVWGPAGNDALATDWEAYTPLRALTELEQPLRRAS